MSRPRPRRPSAPFRRAAPPRHPGHLPVDEHAPRLAVPRLLRPSLPPPPATLSERIAPAAPSRLSSANIRVSSHHRIRDLVWAGADLSRWRWRGIRGRGASEDEDKSRMAESEDKERQGATRSGRLEPLGPPSCSLSRTPPPANQRRTSAGGTGGFVLPCRSRGPPVSNEYLLVRLPTDPPLAVFVLR